MRLVLSLVTCALVCIGLPGEAQAKDLRNRLGVGFDTQISQIPALSIKYVLPASDKAIGIAIEALGGMRLPAEGQRQIVAGGRLLYTVVAEDQMNLYLGLGSMYLSTESESMTFEGLRAQALMGAEFFLYGLDNLGLSLQVGVNVDLGGDTVGVSTGASSLGGLGLHYYF